MNFEDKLITNSRKFNVQKIFKEGSKALYSTLQRFPLTILMFMALACILIYRIEIPYEKIKDINELLDRITGVLVLGIPFSLSVNLLLERLDRNESLLVKLAIYLFEVIILVSYYFILFPNTDIVPVVRLIALTSAMFLAFVSTPYFFRRDNFEIYITKIIIRAIITGFFTIVVAVGLISTLYTIKTLLFSGMNDKLFIYTWIVAWLVFAPIFFLYGLPQQRQSFTSEDYNKVLKVLMLYIILPIMCMYTLVLYSYFGKIIVTQIWPKGIVSYLVLSYAAIGIAILFLITPLCQENVWAKVFTNGFTKLIFPLLGMMFISITIRIGEFGFTENRFFILIIGIWSTLVMIYLNLNKGRQNILLPVSLAVVIFLSVFGPWSAFSVSKMSQNQRFYKILSKYEMVKDDLVVNNSSLIEEADKKEIGGILSYFDKSHKLADLKYLPEGFIFSDMKELFGFNMSDVDHGYRGEYFHYFRNDDQPLDISGYDFLVSFFSYNHKGKGSPYEKKINCKGQDYTFSVDKNLFIVFVGSKEIYREDLREHVEAMKQKNPISKGDIPPEDFVFSSENENMEVKYVYKTMSGTMDEQYNIEGYILVRVK